jgi:hypothetical protein
MCLLSWTGAENLAAAAMRFEVVTTFPVVEHAVTVNDDKQAYGSERMQENLCCIFSGFGRSATAMRCTIKQQAVS